MDMQKFAKVMVIGFIAMFVMAMALPTVLAAPPTGNTTGGGTFDNAPNGPLDLLNQTAEQSGQTNQRTLPEIIGNIIKWVLGVVGIILLVMFIYGGVLYATSAGSEEKVETGKKVMLYAIMGVIIIALAFALTNWVINALFTSTT